MIMAELWTVLPPALMATGVAALCAVPLLAALLWLPPRWSAVLAGALLLLAVLPPRPGPGLALRVLALLPFIVLPPAFALRRIPARALRVAATLASPASVAVRLWLPLAAPWLLAGLALAFARALAPSVF
jgi:ABC-type sulfate transport system permease component